MKQLFLIALTTVIMIVACTSKKSMAKTTNNEPTEIQLTAAKTKFPDISLEVLKKGHGVFTGACTNCHGAKDIPSRSEEEWTSILERMAPKAELSADQKDQVWKYIMSVKLASK
jgi:hypothetical protein